MVYTAPDSCLAHFHDVAKCSGVALCSPQPALGGEGRAACCGGLHVRRHRAGQISGLSARTCRDKSTDCLTMCTKLSTFPRSQGKRALWLIAEAAVIEQLSLLVARVLGLLAATGCPSSRQTCIQTVERDWRLGWLARCCWQLAAAPAGHGQGWVWACPDAMMMAHPLNTIPQFFKLPAWPRTCYR